MWSLGGILSEALVWCLGGKSLLKKYRNLRQNELRTLFECNLRGYQQCFHDKKIALKCIHTIHQEALSRKMERDDVSAILCREVEQNLLVPLEGRYTPEQLLYHYRAHKCDLLSNRHSVVAITNNYPPRSVGPFTAQFRSRDYFPLSANNIEGSQEINSEYGHFKNYNKNSNSYGSRSTTTIRANHRRMDPNRLRSRVLNQESQYIQVNEPLKVYKERSLPLNGRGRPVSSDQASTIGLGIGNVLHSHGTIFNEQNQVVSQAQSSAETQTVSLFALSRNLPVHHVPVAWRNRSDLQRLPCVTVSQVNEHKKSRTLEELPGCREAFDYLERKYSSGCDIVFLIDDSNSMVQYREDVRDTAKALMALGKRFDANGIDLYFASAPDSSERSAIRGRAGQTQYLVDKVDKKLRSVSRLGTCEMRNTIEELAKNLYNKKKPTSLYALTDGVWDKSNKERGGGVDIPLSNLAKDLFRDNRRRSHFTVQFIQFGQDSKGTARLKFLDNFLSAPDSAGDGK